jgi:hypothetical protein
MARHGEPFKIMIYIIATIFLIQIFLKIFIHPGVNSEIIIKLFDMQIHFATLGVSDNLNIPSKIIALTQIIALIILLLKPNTINQNKYLKTFASTFYIMSPGIILNSIEGLIFNYVYNTFGIGIEFSCNTNQICGKWITMAISLGDICLYISLIYTLYLSAFNQNKLVNYIDTMHKKQT